ncbi:EAL domain-containing protein [Rheinheimera sp. MMS21-TC3]|uniref:EAL domain-containing protein n=1 Tax=Rheinheimera sp. MMS21-TC3 TaxID=3072790 RepID=UPI0028C3A8C4|nr:EAL domain-containing protein [Rheinheimera sp. MMS21-TC3]WNO60306.1 EAL domain-containing protein [Rheinheimera sp. MMS21-TC3]
MRVYFGLLLAYLYLVTAPVFALDIEVNSVNHHLKSNQALSQLYFQVTEPHIKLEDLLASPDLPQQFQQLTHKDRVQFNEHQTTWFLARIVNTDFRTIQTVLDYHFPLADKVEIYQVDKKNKSFKLLSRTGNDFPFTERNLPYRSYAVNLELARAEETDIYIKVRDAAIIPSNFRLWQPEAFIRYQQHTAMFDGMLQGVMWLLALYNLVLLYRSRNKVYFYHSVFFISFALTIAILNGTAFSLLWPQHPEINQATLYLSVGLAMLMFNLAISHILGSYLKGFWRFSNIFSTISALLLLFSPLFASGEARLYLLFICIFWVLGSNLILALRLSLAGKSQSTRFIWVAIFTLISIALLTVTQAGHFEQVLIWPYILLAIVLFSLALTIFNLHGFKTPKPDTDHAEMLLDLKLYYDLFHSAVEGMFITSLNGQLINANLALAKILGYDSLAQLKQATEKTGMSVFYTDAQQRAKIIAKLHTEHNRNFETKAIRADGSIFWVLMSARLSQSPHSKETIIHGSVIDITEQKQANDQLAYLANHDPLTALFNRYCFEQQIINLFKKKSNNAGCVLFIDIDQFSLVNDSCSHSAGDALLKQLSQLLKHNVASNGTVARLDGDEFGILLIDKSINEAFALAYSLLDAMKEFKFIWQDKVFSISLGIGITEILPHENNADTIIKRAAAACILAKEKGQNRIQLYDAKDRDTQRYQEEINWVSLIRQAIEQDQFILYQQIIKPLATAETGFHYEILLRLRTADNHIIGPSSFMSSAERYGLMPLIDRWVIKQYFYWLQQHPEHIKQLHLCCINLSGNSLTDINFKQDVQKFFTDFSIPYQLICFEITETVAIVNLQSTLDFINHFRQLGCQFSLDDFGSGFSSYGYLKSFPADYVKIDGHFVRDILNDQYDRAIVKSIHDIAHAMGMRTVAEYVENEQIVAELQQLNIDFAQGYAIAKPQPLADLLK